MNGEYRTGDVVLGSWTLVKLLGEGAYGKVYEAHREGLGTTYTAAIKIMTIPPSQSEVASARAEGMDEESVTAYFRGMVADVEQEFALMSRLKGMTNVVSCEDFQVVPHTEGLGWDILIRMELLTPMLNYMSGHEMTRADIIKLGVDMCKALELCQRYKIIHRDIKPENIFISDTGDYKLGDFGVARTLEKTTGGLSKKGPYTYMAPEIYREEKYGSTVDIYSLGVVLYRLLNNNRAPFLPQPPAPITHSERERALMRRIGGEPLPPPANAEGRLAEIVLKACAFQPGERYSSPLQMRQELEAIQYGRGEDELIYGKDGRIRVERSAWTKPGEPDGDATVYEPRRAAAAEDEETVYEPRRPSEAPDEGRTVSVGPGTEAAAKLSAPAAEKKKKKTGLVAGIAAALVLVIAALIVLLPKLRQSDPTVSATPASETPASEAELPVPASQSAGALPDMLAKLCSMSYEEARAFFLEHHGDEGDLWSELEWVPDGSIYYSQQNRLFGLADRVNNNEERVFFFYNEEGRFEYALHVENLSGAGAAKATAENWQAENQKSGDQKDTDYISWGDCVISLGGPHYAYSDFLAGTMLEACNRISDFWTSLAGTEPVDYDALYAAESSSPVPEATEVPEATPGEIVLIDGAWDYGALRITVLNPRKMHVELTDERIPNGYPMSETPGKNDPSWNIILTFDTMDQIHVYLTGSAASSFQTLSSQVMFMTGADTVMSQLDGYTMEGNTFIFDLEIPESVAHTAADVKLAYVNLGTETQNFVDHYEMKAHPVDLSALTEAEDAEDAEGAEDAAGWVTLDTTGKEGELTVLSYYVSNGRKIVNPDAFLFSGETWLSFEWVDNTTTYNTLVCEWSDELPSEEYIQNRIAFYLRLWRSDLVLSNNPQSKVTTGLPEPSGKHCYVLLVCIGKDFTSDGYVLYEIGVPEKTISLDESWDYGAVKISTVDQQTLHVELTDDRIPDGFPHSKTPGNNRESWDVILDFGRDTSLYSVIELRPSARSLNDFHLTAYIGKGNAMTDMSFPKCTLKGNTFSFDIRIPESSGYSLKDIQTIYVDLGTETDYLDSFSYVVG